MGGKGSAPKAPDYVGAANAQAAASKEVTNIQNFANRPTINTPFGSESWQTQASIDPATGQRVTSWTQNTTLAPGLQAALDAQVGTQLGRSNLANDFMGRVANEYSQPFDWQNLPQMAQVSGAPSLYTGMADYAQGLNTGVNSRSGDVVGGFSFGGPQMGIGSNPVDTQFEDMQGGIQRGVQQYGLNTQFDPMQGGLARNVQQQNLQRSLMTGDNPALPQFDSSYRDSVAQSLIERMMPVHDRQRNEIETQLANAGYTVGSEGYTRALADMQARQAAERYNALDTAGAEAQRLYNMQMGSRQQAFNEDLGMGQFSNAAANQAFQQALGANQFQNQATAQAYQQALNAQQAENQALGQQFGQGLQAGQFGNQATAQAYQQALGAQQAANQAQGQLFQQNLGAAQFGNQAQQQLFGQNMNMADLANRANAQAFGQDLAATQFGNQALGQAAALDQSRMGAMNQALGQQFAMNQQLANQQNQLRQQAIAEQMQRRGMSLNEMNALLSGQQVNMPQMPNFVQAGRSETPNILGATQAGYDAALGAYNAQQAGFGNFMGGLFSLGGAAMAPGAGSLFGFGR